VWRLLDGAHLHGNRPGSTPACAARYLDGMTNAEPDVQAVLEAIAARSLRGHGLSQVWKGAESNAAPGGHRASGGSPIPVVAGKPLGAGPWRVRISRTNHLGYAGAARKLAESRPGVRWALGFTDRSASSRAAQLAAQTARFVGRACDCNLHVLKGERWVQQ